ncbi:MAG: transposase, partial [Gammaproteobacteria bacterium]|nr:transposase [Gammaproteobacteria bacterium]
MDRLTSASGTLQTSKISQRASDGTTHVIFESLDFIAKLASLVPKPRVNLTRFHGVFVGMPHHPNSKHRTLVTTAR